MRDDLRSLKRPVAHSIRAVLGSGDVRRGSHGGIARDWLTCVGADGRAAKVAPHSAASMTFARISLVSSLLLAASCKQPLIDGRCGPEFRSVIVRGDIRAAAGTRAGVAELRLTEFRRTVQPWQLNVILMGPAYADPGPLSAHVLAVRLVDPTGTVLRDFSFRLANQHEIVWVPAEYVADATAFAALERQFKAGELVLEIDTDLPDEGRVRVPLPLQSASGWLQADCS